MYISCPHARVEHAKCVIPTAYTHDHAHAHARVFAHTHTGARTTHAHAHAHITRRRTHARAHPRAQPHHPHAHAHAHAHAPAPAPAHGPGTTHLDNLRRQHVSSRTGPKAPGPGKHVLCAPGPARSRAEQSEQAEAARPPQRRHHVSGAPGARTGIRRVSTTRVPTARPHSLARLGCGQ